MNLRDFASRRNGKPVSKPPARTTRAAQEKPAVKPPAGPVAWFDSSRGCFWVQNTRGDWIQHTESAYKRILRYETFEEITDKDLLFVTMDRHMMASMREHDVAFCQPIGGYQPGVHEIMGQRILCTTGPKLLKPVDKPWPTFRKLVDELLGERAGVFFCWMKSALRSLYAGPPFRPGQMLVLAGQAKCGKSLMQNIITELLGGRVAKPYRYMTDRTTFNSDLIGSEHLMIEDDPSSRDVRTRRHFGAQLKNMVAGEGQSLHRKGRDALMVNPFSRITLSVNDEPESLSVLPPLDDSIEDKIILLRCRPATFPYSADDIRARQQWRAAVSAELPAFLRFLQTYKIPPKMVCQRYGVKHYHDPDLLHAIRQLQEEMQLWYLMEELQIWGIDNENFRGTANELKVRLLEKDKHGRVKNLLTWEAACGVYLTRLQKIFPSKLRFKEMHEGRREYEICHPSKSFS